MNILPREVWNAQRERDLARIRPWVEARLRRQSRHEKHPVHDFLFEYYEFRPSRLLRWSPGFDVLLAGAARRDNLWPDFVADDNGLSLPAALFSEHRIPYLNWAIEYLETTSAREPSFGCMGLHEWAMVYRDPNFRHPQVPLRLSRAETDAVVEAQGLRCTHFDAYRFFSRAAAPLNRWELTRTTTTEHDQPGCIHVTMDLYRFAYKIAPFTPSGLIYDAFELALQAREIDMRASPYDLTAFGYAPLKIETAEGRAEYLECQRALYALAQPLRRRLIELYRGLRAARTLTRSVGEGVTSLANASGECSVTI
jgi:hypothetical protein